MTFLGGSIFIIKGCLLEKLRGLQINQKDWPVEAGQIDGTKGHQIERIFSVLCIDAGLHLQGVEEPK